MATTAQIGGVYVLRMAAAVRLLPPHSTARRIAVVALVKVIVMLLGTGRYVLWIVVLAGGALFYQAARTRREWARAGQCASNRTADHRKGRECP